MTPRSTTSIVDRLRKAGTVLPSSPDIDAIVARAARRKRRRQIGVTAASLVAVGGLGVSTARLITEPGDTTISAAGEPSTPAPTTDIAIAPLAPGIEPADHADDSVRSGWQPAPTTTAVTTTTPSAGATPSMQAALRAELSDETGGAIVVDHGQLMHRHESGDLVTIELPIALATTDRRVTDVALLDERPYLLISDFTDRPDLVADPTDTNDAPMHQELAIYAVDLTTDEVHVVEERTITERHSPSWVYNGLVTAQNGHIVVIRELWQSMCVYVESLTLDGVVMATPENPLPEPSLAGLDDDTIRDMQVGLVDPPRGCISASELPDGAMSVLGGQADPAAIDSVNSQLRSAAALTAEALDRNQTPSD